MRICNPGLVVVLIIASTLAAACGDDGSASATETDTGAETDTTSAGSTTSVDSETGVESATDTDTDTDTGGTTEDPSPFDGEPLPPADPGDWIWVDFPEALCRDGSSTGIGVRYGAENKVVIFFEGGGACFNQVSCLTNPSAYNGSNFDGWKDGGGQSGIFNLENPDNPVGEWSFVYVPYCTGDVHAGDSPGSEAPGSGGPQQFVGYRNVEAFLERVYPTFKGAEQVLVTGVSAGGFGAALNYPRISDSFKGEVVLLDDSGPPMADMFLKPCLQSQWREFWGLDMTLPASCDDCFPDDGGGLVNLISYYGEAYPNEVKGLISSEQDSVIRTFYGFGGNDCKAILPTMSGAEYKDGLYDLRDNYIKDGAMWGSFIIPGETHTWIGGNGTFYNTEVSGMLLVDWVTDLLARDPVHISP
ncbi:MAG: hypothetical protein IPK80_10240 [Nannocystis sp.]|nr:hypothetical protein [Nannocystis sp.]